MKSILSSTPLQQDAGIAFLRILTGALMTYHGLQVFHPNELQEYTTWNSIKGLPAPLFMVYLGKGLELITGLCFVFGIFTRIAAVLMALDMLAICFVVGGGKFYYEDQHPFIFALLAMVFFFTGPGGLSLDSLLFTHRTKTIMNGAN